MSRNVIVWGNCQAEPLATMLAEPLARADLTVVPVPPVFLIDPPMLAQVRQLVAESAWLLAQPIRDEYRVPGCGTDQLAAHLPPGGRLVRLPSAFDAAAFPFQALAHDGTGERVAAPVTNYHDLRLIVASARGSSAGEVLSEWPRQPGSTEFDAHARHSWDSLTARESALDVSVSPVIRRSAAMFAVNHPSNATLAHLAGEVLRLIGVGGAVQPPEREFLGSTRTAVEQVPAARLGWEASPWRVDGSRLDPSDVVRRQLDFYAARPDIVTDSLSRFAERIELLCI